jgi:hypothetical protein
LENQNSFEQLLGLLLNPNYLQKKQSGPLIQWITNKMSASGVLSHFDFAFLAR